MHKISHKDFSCLASIIDSIDKIEKYTGNFKNADEFYGDNQSFDASMMNFIIIGEMVEKLSEDFKMSTEDKINWHKIKSLRNIVAHNYFGIDAEEVWQIINGSLKTLKVDIEKIIN